MKAVDFVEIEHLIPIFKNGEPANAIEVARVKTREGVSIQYDIIVGKGLHKIGSQAIYIQPDYTIPQTSLFAEYHAPFGDPKKCKLGKKGRVRAIKFNFQFEGSTDPIYSNGILIPISDFVSYVEKHADYDDENGTAVMRFGTDKEIQIPRLILPIGEKGAVFGINYNDPEFPYQEVLGIEKYVADDNLDGSQPAGMTKGDFPSFLYKTDEETIQNHREEVDACYAAKEILSFTQKRDGSSMTEYVRINPIEKAEEKGICSRKQEKKLEQTYTAAYKDGDIVLHPYFHPELKIKGWFNDETRTFYTNEEVEQFEPIIEEQRDAWIDTDKKYGYLSKLVEYCQNNKLQLCMRGELVGQGNKGSGNKLNSDARTEAKVIWFGVDDLSTGRSKRLHYGDEYNLKRVCEDLGFEYTQELFEGVYSYEDIIAKAHEYFKMMKETYGIVVEGVVIRTKYSNNLSVKYINPEYDANS
jgi:hypothetical protein